MPADYPFQLTNLLFILIPVIKALIDSNLQLKKHRSVNHKKSITLFIFLGFIVAYVDFKLSDAEYFIQSVFMQVACFTLIFDYLRNVLVRKPVFYIDSNPDSDSDEDSWFDTKVYAAIGPLGTLFLKAWIMLCAVACYYFSSYI